MVPIVVVSARIHNLTDYSLLLPSLLHRKLPWHTLATLSGHILTALSWCLLAVLPWHLLLNSLALLPWNLNWHSLGHLIACFSWNLLTVPTSSSIGRLARYRWGLWSSIFINIGRSTEAR